MTFKEWRDQKLVPEWRAWWKLWSMRLGLIATAALTYLLAAPDALQSALNALPPDIRATLPVWVGPLCFGALFVARFWNQAKHHDDHK